MALGINDIAVDGMKVGTVGFRGAALHKTSAFMDANPFGTVPVAFSPDGKIGIFESDSIMRGVAPLGERGVSVVNDPPSLL